MPSTDSGRLARVLVVDDEEPVRALVERALGPVGYHVMLASSGEGALRVVAEQGSFDLYVLDFLMPEMRGDELARQLRAKQPTAKVLFFTGQSEGLLEGRESVSQHEAFVDKPLSINALREAVSLMVFGQARPPR